MCSKIFLKSAKSLHPNLQVHPAVHHAVLPREPHLLVVQHGHLERLELNPLLDEAAPLAVDLPGRVPDLLDVGVHLDDDDVGDNGRHLGRGGGGGGGEEGRRGGGAEEVSGRGVAEAGRVENKNYESKVIEFSLSPQSLDKGG